MAATTMRLLRMDRFGDVGCLGERRIDGGGVAVMVVHEGVAGHFVVQQRRIGGQSGARCGDRRQRFDVEHHRLGGVARLLGCLGDDDGHGVADVAHLVRRQCHLAGPGRGRPVRVLAGGGRHRLDPRRLEIGGDDDAVDAGHGGGFGRVDAAQGAVRVA